HPIAVVIAVTLASREQGPVRGHLGHYGAGVTQLVGERLARDVGAGKEETLTAQVSALLERGGDRLRAVLVRREIDADPEPRELLRRSRTDGADPRPFQVPDVAV